MVGAGEWPRGREEVSLQPGPVQENPEAESKAAESLSPALAHTEGSWEALLLLSARGMTGLGPGLEGGGWAGR